MFKIKNKQVVNEVAKTTYKAHWKRNFISIFAIMLTTFMIAVVIGIGVSYWNTISERQRRMEGMDYDIELTEPTTEQVKKTDNLESVKHTGVAVKCALVLQQDKQLINDAKLYWLDKNCWEKQTVPAIEQYSGTYPQLENEIMLFRHFLDAAGITKPVAGMKISLTYVLLTEETDEETAGENGAEADAKLQKDFVLSGWYSDYTGMNRGYVSEAFFKKTGVRQTDFGRGTLKISLRNSLYSEDDLLAMQEEIGLGSDQLLIGNEEVIAQFIKMMFVLAGILLMVLASGYLFIYNTMYISVSKDIRYYGQLKTIGMTTTQLRRVVWHQIFINSVTGIPTGLILAAGITRKIIPHVLVLVNQELESYEIDSARLWVYAAVGIFALITNLISCREPVKIVEKCSPVEALSYTTGAKQKRRNKNRKRVSLYTMASQNIFRDKKQAFIIFVSFIIGVSVFLTANIFIYENDAAHILNETWNGDIKFVNQTTLEKEKPVFTEENISRIKAVTGVKSVGKVTSAWADVPYQEDVFGEYYQALYQTRYAPGDYKEDIEEYKKDPKKSSLYQTGFISIDREGFEHINERLGNTIDAEAFERGEVAVATKRLTEGDNNMTGKTVRFYLPGSGEPKKEHSIQIAAVDTDGLNNPAFFSRGFSPDLIVSESYARKLLGDLYVELIEVKYEEAYSEETEEQVKAVLADKKKIISHDSKLELYQDMKGLETQAKVLGYSIDIIIALLVLLNYINIMAAGVLNRSKEFAVLESIGMTKRQMKKMLRIEGAGYGVISIIGALPIGLVCGYLVFENTKQYFISFAIPWFQNLLLFLAVLIICVAAPIIIYRKIYRQSIIEQIKAADE